MKTQPKQLLGSLPSVANFIKLFFIVIAISLDWCYAARFVINAEKSFMKLATPFALPEDIYLAKLLWFWKILEKNLCYLVTSLSFSTKNRIFGARQNGVLIKKHGAKNVCNNEMNAELIGTINRACQGSSKTWFNANTKSF